MNVTAVAGRRCGIRGVAAILIAGFLWTGSLSASAPAGLARKIIDESKVPLAVAVHVGCEDGELMAALAESEKFLVHGLAPDQASLAKVREQLETRGVRGVASAETWDGKSLPYASNLINVMIIQGGAPPEAEVLRVLCPRGLAYRAAGEGTEKSAEDARKALAALGVSEAAALEAGGPWLRFRKPWPKGMGEWTHCKDGNAAGTATSTDTSGPPTGLRWLAGPHEPIPTTDFRGANCGNATANGKVVFISRQDVANRNREAFARSDPQARWHLWWGFIVRDAFNGLRLWGRSLDSYRAEVEGKETSPAADAEEPQGNTWAWRLRETLVIDGDRIYGLVYTHLIAIDANTGKLLRTYKTPPGAFGDGVSKLTAGADVLLAEGLLVVGGKGGVWAFQPETGKLLWECTAPGLWVDKLIAGDGRVFFKAGAAVGCLDLKTGRKLWQVVPTRKWEELRLYTAGVVLGVWGVDKNSTSSSNFSVLSAEDGKVLWEGGRSVGHYVADGLIWTREPLRGGKAATDKGDEPSEKTPPTPPAPAGGKGKGKGKAAPSTPPNALLEGHDPKTGQVKRSFKVWGDSPTICRIGRLTATENYMVSARGFIRLHDLKTGETSPVFPTRSMCGTGMMVANGLFYGLPHACECNSGGVRGFHAAVHETLPGPEALRPAPGRLVKGPAFGQAAGQAPPAEPAFKSMEWPTFRHDPQRSNATHARLADRPVQLWQVDLSPPKAGQRLIEEWTFDAWGGERLTAPTVAEGKVFVGVMESHELVAIDAATGKEAWRFTAGGRLDTPPTVYRGLCLFGSNDGWAYCLRASDGLLVWKFRAAPLERKIMAYGQLESPWPVVGGVLVEQGTAHLVAGWSDGVDGGLFRYALDPLTGQVKEGALATGKNLVGNVLVSDGRNVGLAQQLLAKEGWTSGGAAMARGEELGCLSGYMPHGVTNRIFNRMWHWPSARRGGLAGGVRWGFVQKFWGSTGGLLVAGRPDVRETVSFVQPMLGPDAGAPPERTPKRFAELGGHLIALGPDPQGTTEQLKRRYVENFPDFPPARYVTGHVREFFGQTQMRWRWKLDVANPRQVEAIALAENCVLAAGPADRTRRQSGEGFLWALATETGKTLSEHALPAPPVSDGLAVVDGRLYVSTQDGRITCLGEK